MEIRCLQAYNYIEQDNSPMGLFEAHVHSRQGHVFSRLLVSLFSLYSFAVHDAPANHLVAFPLQFGRNLIVLPVVTVNSKLSIFHQHQDSSHLRSRFRWFLG